MMASSSESEMCSTSVQDAARLSASRVFSFGDLGTVTIGFDLDWLALPVTTTTRLRQIVDELERLSRLEPAVGLTCECGATFSRSDALI